MPLEACRDSRNASFPSIPRIAIAPKSPSFPSTPRAPRNTRNPRKAYAHKKANPYFSLAFLAYSNSEEGRWQYPPGFLSR